MTNPEQTTADLSEDLMNALGEASVFDDANIALAVMMTILDQHDVSVARQDRIEGLLKMTLGV